LVITGLEVVFFLFLATNRALARVQITWLVILSNTFIGHVMINVIIQNLGVFAEEIIQN